MEHENFIPRIIEGNEYENKDVLLLSNGSYSTMISSLGTGYSKKEMPVHPKQRPPLSEPTAYHRNQRAPSQYHASCRCKGRSDGKPLFPGQRH